MDERPILQNAETDGLGPAKRRRRPALSCVECRLRKVRCDRNKPCEACTKIKSATCTYRPHRPGIRPQSKESQEAPSSSTSYSQDRGHGLSTRSSPQLTVATDGHNATADSFVAPMPPQQHVHVPLSPVAVDKSNPDQTTPSDGSASVISSLLDRINTLENKLASTHLEDRPQNDAWEGSSVGTGQFIKSKCTGTPCYNNTQKTILTQ